MSQTVDTFRTAVLEKQFSTAIPVSDMNESLQIIIDSQEPTVKAGSTIGLTVYNKSSHSVAFDNNSFVTLLGSVDNQQWFPIKNSLTYSDQMSLSPQGTPLLDFYHTWVKPVFPVTSNTDKKEVLLRIVLVGKVMDGDIVTKRSMGTYTDVHLEP